MNKSKELRNTTDLVHELLKTQPKTRNSDNYLYYKVCAIIGKENGINIDSMSMPTFFLHLNEYGFPAFETVRRTRQKLQASHRELASDSSVEAQRILNEETFKDYARGFV